MTYTTRPELFAQPGLSAIFGPSRGSDAWDTLNELGRFRLKRALKKAVKKVAKVAHTAVKVAVPVYGAATLLKKKKRRAAPAAAEPIEPPEVPADLAPVPYEASIQVQPTYMQRGMVQVAAPVPAALTYAEPSAYDGAQPVYARQVAVAPMVQRTGGYEFQEDPYAGGSEPEYVEDPPAPPLYEPQPDLFQNEGEEMYGLGSGGLAGLGKFSLKKIGRRVGKALKPLARPLLKTAAGLVGAGGLVDMFDRQKQVAAAAASQGPPSPSPAQEKKGDATPWVIGGAAAVALLLLMKKR